MVSPQVQPWPPRPHLWSDTLPCFLYLCALCSWPSEPMIEDPACFYEQTNLPPSSYKNKPSHVSLTLEHNKYTYTQLQSPSVDLFCHARIFLSLSLFSSKKIYIFYRQSHSAEIFYQSLPLSLFCLCASLCLPLLQCFTKTLKFPRIRAFCLLDAAFVR